MSMVEKIRALAKPVREKQRRMMREGEQRLGVLLRLSPDDEDSLMDAESSKFWSSNARSTIAVEGFRGLFAAQPEVVCRVLNVDEVAFDAESTEILLR
jgi:hypothetical protein